MSVTLMISGTTSIMLWALLMFIFKGEFSSHSKFKKRATLIALSYGIQPNTKIKTKSPRAEQSIKIALKELEVLKRRSSRWSLSVKIRQAGLQGSALWYLVRMFFVDSLVVGFLLWSGVNQILVGVIGAVLLYVLTYGRLGYLTSRRISKISTELPVALDVVYRAIRAGLPLIEAMKLAANETAQPLQGELKQVLRDLSVGMSLEEAVQRFAARVPTNDVSFFANVINIQTITGGNMSTAIGNLVVTMRERDQLVNRITSLTSEVSTSAKIIGTLPILAILGLMFYAPSVTDLLFQTFRGNLVLGASVVWMGIGVIVMRQMTKVGL